MRIFRVKVLFLVCAIVVGGCSSVNAKKVNSVTLECIQVCLTMENRPFDKRTYEEKKEIELFVQAVNQADKMEGMLDYGAIFLMTIRMRDGSTTEYHFNIENTERPQNGLLLKLPDTGQGYLISKSTSEKLKDIIYRT